MEDKEQQQKIMEITMEVGIVLLESGAEIFRIEETMHRICRAFGVMTASTFILSNGIFLTAGGIGRNYAKVKHVPVQGGRLDRVAAVNQLSREIEKGMYTPEQVEEQLMRIKEMPAKSLLMQVFAAGMSSACFCFMIGGRFADSCVAFLAGSILHLYVLKIRRPYLTGMFGNILGGAIVTLICIGMYNLNIGSQMNQTVTGAIIPLVPGIAFTNGIRDIADGDYISGAVRMLDAGLVFLCIALGVSVVFFSFSIFFGGIIL